MKIISTEELRRRLEEETPAVFDVRGDVDYEYGHIPGARTAPLGSLVFRVARLMNPDSFVAVYSSGKGCTLAAQAADRLESLGLKNVHVYADGISGWQSAGLPVVESNSPKVQARGPVLDCRPIVVDRERAYGGAFAGPPTEVAGAGG
ncbi:MAG: rhodanese-like domain-containing protein [Deltaproteobacteria bacterium]|jgi:rhodanese-related sulfurtransferase|nr:rhodanese-like domain-containing protein [Deltaproteobacteria bacterium]MBW2537665.1 rhodanese-like domain-containing protein [Deltaproteobacteria bacterium]